MQAEADRIQQQMGNSQAATHYGGTTLGFTEADVPAPLFDRLTKQQGALKGVRRGGMLGYVGLP